VEPFRVSPGFIAFLSAMILPAVAALAIFFGAWMVSGEVYAAEQPAGDGSLTAADFSRDGGEVAGWKRTLVGVCPLH
jgi:hypothetical protein